mgnify:CR=1 FL=1
MAGVDGSSSLKLPFLPCMGGISVTRLLLGKSSSFSVGSVSDCVSMVLSPMSRAERRAGRDWTSSWFAGEIQSCFSFLGSTVPMLFEQDSRWLPDRVLCVTGTIGPIVKERMG